MRSQRQSGPSVPTILVVDDEPAICRSLRKILRKEGYQVVIASSGRQALELAAQSPPQLVLMDVMMPGLDGVSALRELRTHGHQEPVIMLTGHGTLQTAREAMLLGACSYITKPFDLETLRLALREGLEGRQVEGACAP
jgi:DNA-binding response OmpR family regulator